MEMVVDFPGGAKVDVHFGDYTVKTDQSVSDGGEGTAPSPFEFFLASIGACAGIYVHGFCKQRNLSTDDIRVIEKVYRNPETGMVEKISLEIQAPPSFPQKYLPSLVRSAELCTVKKHLEHPPEFDVYTHVTD